VENRFHSLKLGLIPLVFVEGEAALKKLLTLLIIAFLLLSAFHIRLSVKANPGTIYIRWDGSIDPPTAPIQRDGNTYTLTSNITDSIVVQRNNIVFDGAGFTIQNQVDSIGIDLSERNHVTVENTIITGSGITGLGCGIRLSGASENSLVSNILTKMPTGIWLLSSSYNTLSGNTLEYNADGIYLGSSFSNTIWNNNITNSDFCGVDIDTARAVGNTVSDNKISHSGFAGIGQWRSSHSTFSGNIITNGQQYGIQLYQSDYNAISNNNITKNRWGIVADSSNNTISGNTVTDSWQWGICVSGYAEISGNVVANNQYGIYQSGRSSKITDNVVKSNNLYGIYLSGTNGSLISGNSIVDNDYGTGLDRSYNNLIHHNDFINNAAHVKSTTSKNIWDDGYQGNYWSDYTRYPDAHEVDDSGIWDTPYVIDENNQDNHPLMKPYARACGEIVDFDRESVKGVYKVSERIYFNVVIKNTGYIDGTFWVNYVFLSPGTTATSYSGPLEQVDVNSGEKVAKSLSWTVPNDAPAGAYSLSIYLYDKDPRTPLQTTIVDTESIPCAIMIDRDTSYIQIQTISSFTGEQRAIHIHIADHDIAKSGTLTFKLLISAFQLAKLAVGLEGTSCLAILGRGFNEIKAIWRISDRAVKLYEDGTADILVLQFIGDVGFLYEASLLDIGSIPEPVTPTPIPKEFLKMPSPYFSEILFDWTLVSYMPIMETYFPYWKFSKNEQWYPTSFYFDNNTNVADNKDNYARAGERPPYYVYIHVVGDEDYLTIQYWMYFVYNSHWSGDHMHDWDARVYVIFDRDNLETPIKVGFSYHIWSYTCDWEDLDIESRLEKVGTHVIAYVANGSHGSYHSRSAMLVLVDKFEAGGISLGYENLTNWVIAGYCEKETPNGDFCLVDYNDCNCIHPTPTDAIRNGETYWPKDFDPEARAAWHQDETWHNTIPPKMHILVVEAHSPVNILVQDSMGRSTGTDETGVVRTEVPNAMYSGSSAEPEAVIVDSPSGEYEVYVYGVEDGTFDMTAWTFSNGSKTTLLNLSDVSIQKGQVLRYTVLGASQSPFPIWIVAVIVIVAGLGAAVYLLKIRKKS